LSFLRGREFVGGAMEEEEIEGLAEARQEILLSVPTV
jgi:hypothetical protein